LGGAPPETSERLKNALVERKARHSAGDLLRMLQAIIEIEPLYRKSGQQQLLLETLLLRLALLDRTVELEDVLRGFGSGQYEDPPTRRTPKTESRTNSASASANVVEQPVATPVVMEPPAPRSATQQVAEAAALQQETAARSAVPPAETRTRARRGSTAAPPTIENVRLRWPEVAESVKSAGRGALAQAVQRMEPQLMDDHGMLHLSYAAADDTFAGAVDRAKNDVLQALQGVFEGITAFNVRSHKQQNAAAPRSTQRLTAQDVQQQRTELLTSRNALLDAAVRTLDLELLD
jgi:DNA polymerase-3 subunit gamma/tau